MAKIYGQLERAQFENLSADPSTGIKGRVWFNTSTGLIKFEDGTTVFQFASLAGTEVFTNKTLTAPTINTPAVSNGTWSAPAITGGTIASLTAFSLRDTSAAFDVTLAAVSSTTMTANRILTLDMKNAARTISLAGNLTVSAAADVSGTNSGDVTRGAIGAANAFGFTVTGQVIALCPASSSFPGVVDTSGQIFAGLKQFNNGITLPTSGGTAATLDHYEEGTFSADFNQNAGAGGTNVTGKTMSYRRIGKIVTLCFPSISNMTAGATSVIFATATGTLPSRLRPPTGVQFKFPAQAINNAVLQNSGQVQIMDDGMLRIFRDLQESTTFVAATANCGVSAICVTYMCS